VSPNCPSDSLREGSLFKMVLRLTRAPTVVTAVATVVLAVVAVLQLLTFLSQRDEMHKQANFMCRQDSLMASALADARRNFEVESLRCPMEYRATPSDFVTAQAPSPSTSPSRLTAHG
jgi:hypothetical protein